MIDLIKIQTHRKVEPIHKVSGTKTLTMDQRIIGYELTPVKKKQKRKKKLVNLFA